MKKILSKSFFNRPTLIVAEELIGKFLIQKQGKNQTAYMIMEVEAYDGFDDRASHAYRGKTVRNEIMFGEAGNWYVYFIYGMYNVLNIVTGEKEYPAAILIRGIEGIQGPGKLTKFLHIDKKLNKKKASPKSGLWVEDKGVVINKKKIKKTPRIGVIYAGPIWSKKKYRFVLETNPRRP